MKLTITNFILFLIFITNSVNVKAEKEYQLLPYPKEIILNPKSFSFRSLDISILENIDRQEDIKAEFLDLCSSLAISNQSKGKELEIILKPAKQSGKQESYSLTVNRNNIELTASDFGGFFNGLQTLRQLIYKSGDRYRIPESQINDSPAFKVRGVMFDLGRNYIPVSMLKEIARHLSRYKINYFHLHLTDDPGWRIASAAYPQLTDSTSFWKTRQPGKFYTLEELKEICNYCKTLNIEVIPEIDMPGHSQAFRRALGYDMQTEEGLTAVKRILDEVVPVFPSKYFHIGSDEVHIRKKDFIPEVVNHLRQKNKDIIVWHPGHAPDADAIRMCWGENELGASVHKDSRYIDCNGFYLDWVDSQSGVQQMFFQQPCEVEQGNEKALGSMMCVWTDGALGSPERILEQYPFYPCALTFAERLWKGRTTKDKQYMANLPAPYTKAGREFAEFEERLVHHRDVWFKGIPFAYVKQSNIKWKLIGPFDHQGKNDQSFEPESIIKANYLQGNKTLHWEDSLTYGGAVHIRHLYTMFNMHSKRFQKGWPTTLSEKVGTGNGTCYALTYIDSPKEQEVYLMFGLNGMWGHSGGYRSCRAPEQGSWDYAGGDIWLNDQRIEPPHWNFKSLPWTGWGQGRIETPLTEEGYFYRLPIKIHLKKGKNKVLIRSVFGHWKGDNGQRKWMFCCIPVHWDGQHYTEVKDLKFLTQ